MHPDDTEAEVDPHAGELESTDNGPRPEDGEQPPLPPDVPTPPGDSAGDAAAHAAGITAENC